MADGAVLQDVGPVDVDSAGELVKKVGVHNQAKRLIKAVAQNFPPELVAAGSRRVLGGQSQTLDLKEVADAAADAFGKDFEELLGAKVRGSEARPETVAVNIVFLTSSGRTARGIIPYEGLKKSQKAYQKGVEDGTVVIRDDDPEANRKALEEAQRRIVELEAGGASGGSTEEAETPEPFEGYEDVKAADLVKAIEDGEYDLQTLFAIRDAEAEGKERSTVEEAVATKIAAAEAALKPSDD